MKTLPELRVRFESFVTAAPYEKSVERLDGNSSWPGQYASYEVQFAWEAFLLAAGVAADDTPSERGEETGE